MGRRILVVPLAAACWLLTAPAFAVERCVGARPGCYGTVQAAVDAAQDGDTIRVARGTFAGGVTITTSVDLVGAGRNSTILRGGGPVLSIGTFGAATEPTVSVRHMTITGGRTTTSAVPFVEKDGVFATGGGIEIPPGADFAIGATVTISDAEITGNRVAPIATVPGPPCPGGPCPVALAAGGGISNWGTLTLVRTAVTDNRVGSASGISELASDAYSGAIQNWNGRLTLREALITGNEVTATAPNGRFADSGAIFLEGGSLDMTASVVTRNRATLAADVPPGVDAGAIGGALHLSDQVPTGRIRNSVISGNTLSMSNPGGSAIAFSGGVHVDVGVDFLMRDSVVARNRVTADARDDASADSGTGEVHGTVSGTRLMGNTVTAHSTLGDAFALAGAAIMFGTFTDGTVSDNRIQATAVGGTATASGGGLVIDDSGLVLRHARVHGNTADARGDDGSAARGGGIADFPIPNGPPGGPLVLRSTSVTGNAVAGNAGTLLQGGGLYALDQPVSLTHSPIAGNHPDDCVGCP